MAGRLIAIDTNVAIALLNGDVGATAEWSMAGAVFLPAPVLGELLYGAERSGRRTENLRQVWELAESMPLLPCDASVCREYARIRLELTSVGRPIPENDLWIAACCAVAGADLASFDSHFDAVPGLTRLDWAR